MRREEFDRAVEGMSRRHRELITRPNERCESENGLFHRYRYPVVTAAHTPLFWRYDLDHRTNPHLLERFGINAAFNAGAIKWDGRYLLMVRVEGNDRKSFFAVAESPNGVDGFRFWDYPVTLPETDQPETNVYDMRLTLHQDGWIYGLFCAERPARDRKAWDTSAAEAQCGIARTRDLVQWERLPDLVTRAGQQRNVVLHPEFVHGRYALYTRPQEGFIETGTGGGIGFALTERMDGARIEDEVIIDERVYHTVKEVKNGQGPAPLKTEAGWLHLAHGVRNTAAGLRYVLYLFLTSLEDPARVTHRPAGYFLAPRGEERIGDVSNVVFSNGWIADEDGTVFIYYGSSDTRTHVAVSTLERLIDYCRNTPEDGLRSAAQVETLKGLIRRNLKLIR